MTDPFGRAVRDFHLGEQSAPLVQRDGEESFDHPIEDLYFGDGEDEWLLDALSGPLLDVGCGAGRHARDFQDRFETVAVDVSPHLVETARERGVEDARVADMHDLRGAFPERRFASLLCIGTQVCLGPSMAAVSETLAEFARVTREDATAVVDGYDPSHREAEELLGYRADPVPGLASRVFHFEYEDEVGETLQFRLLSPARLREAAVGTGWTVAAVERRDGPYYRARLER